MTKEREEVTGTEDYLRSGNRYYSGEQLKAPRYAMPYPNAEEAQRAGAILEYVGRVGEIETNNGTRPRILEVGCGRGWLSNLLSVFGPVTAIDPASGPIELARGLFPAVSFRQAVLSDLLEDRDFEPFRLVVSSEVLEHVPHAHKEAFLRELFRAVAPGGFAILTTPRREIFRAYLRSHPSSLQPVEDWLTQRELRQLVQGCGFAVLDHRRIRSRRLGALSRIALSGKVHRLLSTLRLEAVRAALEAHYSHYQVLWLRRRTPGESG